MGGYCSGAHKKAAPEGGRLVTTFQVVDIAGARGPCDVVRERRYVSMPAISLLEHCTNACVVESLHGGRQASLGSCIQCLLLPDQVVKGTERSGGAFTDGNDDLLVRHGSDVASSKDARH